MGYIFLVIALTLNASANILLKLGSGRIGELKGLGLVEMIPRLLTNYYLIIGLLFFALNVVFYTIALNRLNLSIAYPIMMAGGVLIITFFSAFVLGESLSASNWVGIGLIAGGLALVVPKG